ncbi:serine-aspartate repeat-containing protein E-like [Vanessa cardui]|uniref:serine-aspartate repeat-containing protein E-like n=1 Tax=Vanessa cardui TaxID=171605 RepID=UPI001F12A0E9|nr:serine-aspartate repeat-containing protein E-like [Vanessa cardui]
MFLDECDLFEYNCDYHKAYLETDLLDCTPKETDNVATSTITTKETLPLVTTEKLNLTTQNIETEKLSTSTNPDSEAPTSLVITNIKSSTSQTKPKNITKITETTFISTAKTTDLTTTPISTIVTDENCTRGDTNMTTDLKVTKETTKNLTEPMSTDLSTHPVSPVSSLKTESTILTTTEITSTSSNLTKNEPSLNTSTANTSVAVTKEYKELSENTIAGNEKNGSSTQDHCKTYPKHCDRPRTWETTVKGETRDFFQILKARFGNRVKVLRDTTHFPQHVNISINDLRISLNEDNESFHYGTHNEG